MQRLRLRGDDRGRRRPDARGSGGDHRHAQAGPRQAAELAKRGIAYVYTGSRVKVQRAVALFLEAHSRETYGVALREHNEAAEWLRALKDRP